MYISPKSVMFHFQIPLELCLLKLEVVTGCGWADIYQVREQNGFLNRIISSTTPRSFGDESDSTLMHDRKMKILLNCSQEGWDRVEDTKYANFLFCIWCTGKEDFEGNLTPCLMEMCFLVALVNSIWNHLATNHWLQDESRCNCKLLQCYYLPFYLLWAMTRRWNDMTDPMRY